jgi:hypothetical protein
MKPKPLLQAGDGGVGLETSLMFCAPEMESCDKTNRVILFACAFMSTKKETKIRKVVNMHAHKLKQDGLHQQKEKPN